MTEDHLFYTNNPVKQTSQAFFFMNSQTTSIFFAIRPTCWIDTKEKQIKLLTNFLGDSPYCRAETQTLSV